MAEDNNDIGTFQKKNSPAQKRLRLVNKAVDIARQLIDFQEEEQRLVLAELVFILRLEDQDDQKIAR